MWTIVHCCDRKESSQCGYCKKADTSYADVLWAYVMGSDIYEEFYNIGFQRSGNVVYKPDCQKTCCPQYAIRCNALEFKISKSQKNVLKKFLKFIESPTTTTTTTAPSSSSTSTSNSSEDKNYDDPSSIGASNSINNDLPSSSSTSTSTSSNPFIIVEKMVQEESSQVLNVNGDAIAIANESPKKVNCDTNNNKDNDQNNQRINDPNCNSNSNKMRGKKKKEIRLEKKKEKLLKQGLDIATIKEFQTKTKEKNKEMHNDNDSFKNMIESIVDNFYYKKRIRMKLVKVQSKEFEVTFDLELELYKKFQMRVHCEKEEKCSGKQFRRFLCQSPLKDEDELLGSYHQLYFLDEKLIAVGVLDILPSSLSSVYFFYDPDFNHLSLGTYGALYEIYFLQQLHKKHPAIQHYLMGYYIHNCEKMKYKGNYYPSYLLCPEMCTWELLDDNLKNRLNNGPMSRLHPGDPSVVLPPHKSDSFKYDLDNNFFQLKILKGNCIMGYNTYRFENGNEDREIIQDYVNLLGPLSGKILLLRE